VFRFEKHWKSQIWDCQANALSHKQWFWESSGIDLFQGLTLSRIRTESSFSLLIFK